MAIKFKMPSFDFFTKADAKTRVFLVFAAVAALVLVIFLIVRYFGSGEAGGGTRVANAPSSLQTVPGSQMSPEFYRAVVQANQQAAQQAQISGGSAVPTLINVTGQQQQGGSGFPDQNCTIICGDENVTVNDDINGLLKQGKINQAEANQLLNMAKNNVPIEEYAAALDELVRQGKLTPEQARALLEKYKKQHTNAALNQSGAFMDNLIKTGQLPIDVATELLASQKRGASPAEYAADLNRLVREGKLTPAAAAQLLAQYTQQQANEEAKKGVFALQKMAKGGEITPSVAEALAALQAKGVSVDDYAAELDRLVKAGKMTPEAAAKLLEQYKRQRAGLGPTQSLNSLVGQEQAKAAALLTDLAKNGKISQGDADKILGMIKAGRPPQEIQAALNELMKGKGLTPDDAQKLMAADPTTAAGILNDLVKNGKLTVAEANAIFDMKKNGKSPAEIQAALNKLIHPPLAPGDASQIMAASDRVAGMRALAQNLTALQGNNASLDDYANALKRAVAAGLISPEMAASLMEQYRAFKTPITPIAGVAPGVEGSTPATADFAALQRTVQTGAPQTTGPAPPDFNVPVTPAGAPAEAPVTETTVTTTVDPAAAAQERQQRIDQLQQAMSGQAQNLINAWQPPMMTHREGSGDKGKTGEGAAGGRGAGGTTTTTTTTTTKTLPLLKAGTILFAVLDTAVDSDYPDTPVMATIIQGPLKGAKLLGKLSLAQGMDKVSLNFTLMDKEGWPTTKGVNAFAIDPDTARTVMASSVDHHYLKRYGAIMATSFLSGYSSAIQTSGSTTTNGIFGPTTTHPELSPASKIAVGLGQIGTTMSSAVASYINTPTTVKVNSGVGLGILFMSEVASENTTPVVSPVA
jgi:polyhydroxyalkanoate synthesis regulator phasin